MSPSALFDGLDAEEISPPTILDASLPLELSGEAVRSRICLFSDTSGKEWALRPDVTLPAAMDEIARRQTGKSEARTVCYDAPVFRLRTHASDPIEFHQIGLERFGFPSDAVGDVDMFKAIWGACGKLGIKDGVLRLGDLGIFPAFVDALDLSEETAGAVKRAFRQEGGVRAYFEGSRKTAGRLSRRMAGMSREDVTAFVEDIFAMTGINPVGARSADEIVERLHQRAREADRAELPAGVVSLTEALLSVEATPDEALEQYRAIALEADLPDLNRILDALEQRFDLLKDAAPELMNSARFSTRFGRRFTYYDGFVFEIAASEHLADQSCPFAAGGRYDQLLSDLSGGDVDVRALGGVIMPHRFSANKDASS